MNKLIITTLIIFSVSLKSNGLNLGLNHLFSSKKYHFNSETLIEPFVKLLPSLFQNHTTGQLLSQESNLNTFAPGLTLQNGNQSSFQAQQTILVNAKTIDFTFLSSGFLAHQKSHSLKPANQHIIQQANKLIYSGTLLLMADMLTNGMLRTHLSINSKPLSISIFTSANEQQNAS